MIVSIEIKNRAYKIDTENPFDVSIPLDFHGAQPNAFGVVAATAKAYETGELIGDTRRGGSCNFEEYSFIPHCNGTHTESIGHITDERISVHECLKDAFVPATLISITPENSAASIADSYAIKLTASDSLITEKSVRDALQKADADWLAALIVRTLPNDAEKKFRRYAENPPPFFSTEAINYIRQKGVKHLLVDMPSIDRASDEGKLANHRVFWNVAPASRRLNKSSLVDHTITEMIYVSDNIKDGKYLLNLQIAAFVADASPSRPRLFGFC